MAADAKLQELQDKKNGLYQGIKELADRQDKWTDEDRSKWETVNKEYDETVAAMTKRREELTNSEPVQKRLQEIEAERRAASNDARIGPDEERRREEHPERIAQRADEDRALALQAWFRCGDADLDLEPRHIEACKRLNFNPRRRKLQLDYNVRYGDPAWCTGGGQQSPRKVEVESRAGLDVATTGAGKETIPQGFVMELEKKLKAFGGPRNVCRVIRTASGNALPWPTWDDTGNTGALLAEATTIGTSVDPTTAAVTFNAYKYSSKPIFASQEIIEDSAFNLAVEIGEALGTRLGRIMSTHDTTGTGSAQPNGIVTAATTAVTAASATAFTADELIDLVHTLDPSYRMGGGTVGFMMHDTVLKYVRKFKDAQGQYLWQPGM